jgi:hypothetical protein
MTTTAERRPAAEPDGAHAKKKHLEHSSPVPAPSTPTYEERIAAAQARRVAAGLPTLGPPRADDCDGIEDSELFTTTEIMVLRLTGAVTT